MTYTDGGFAFTVGRYEVTVDTAALLQSTVSIFATATVNLLLLMGQGAVERAANEAQTGMADGLGIGDTTAHFWGKLNVASKVATIGMAGLGGYYIYLQARSMYYSLKNVYDSFMDAYHQYQADQQAGLTAA